MLVSLRSRRSNRKRKTTNLTLPIGPVPPMGLDRCRPCTISSKDCDGAIPVCSECSGLTATGVRCTYSQPVGKIWESPSRATCNACIRMRSSYDGACPKYHQCPTEADCVYPRPMPTGAHGDVAIARKMASNVIKASRLIKTTKRLAGHSLVLILSKASLCGHFDVHPYRHSFIGANCVTQTDSSHHGLTPTMTSSWIKRYPIPRNLRAE
jgi:hypothetical protein